jgi:hypothetical protein
MPCLPQGSRPFAWYNVRTHKTEHPSPGAITLARRRRRRRRLTRLSFHWLLLPALWLTTMAVYQPVWHGGLLWDDGGHLTRAALQSTAGLWRIWFDLGAMIFCCSPPLNASGVSPSD